MRVIAALMASTLALLAVPAPGEIVFTGGGADLTFFYDRPNGSFDVVFRDKGSAEATVSASSILSGSVAPYTPPQGVLGGGNDLTFSSLHLMITDPQQGWLNGNSYNTTGPSPAPGRPDLGLRTRFLEQAYDAQGNPVSGQTINQFDSVEFKLDWANSTKPAGAEFALWNFDGKGDPVILFETADEKLATNFGISGHSHWIYGFSELGDYDLAFTVQGIGGAFGDSSVGTFRLGVTAVPEPMTGGLLAVGLGCLAVGRFVRRRRSAQGSPDSAEPVAV